MSACITISSKNSILHVATNHGGRPQFTEYGYQSAISAVGEPNYGPHERHFYLLSPLPRVVFVGCRIAAMRLCLLRQRENDDDAECVNEHCHRPARHHDLVSGLSSGVMLPTSATSNK